MKSLVEYLSRYATFTVKKKQQLIASDNLITVDELCKDTSNMMI